MNIKKDRLYVIGRLIGIYREQRRGKSQNSFTQKSFAKDICSVNTLKRIESGETARDEYVYQSLLAKFNLKLGYYEDVDNYIESLMDSLYDAIEYYRLEDILTICGKALRVLNEVKEYIYYNELYVLFKSTYQYYKEDIEVDEHLMNQFIEVFSIQGKSYESLYKRMIFLRAQIIAMDSKEIYYKIVEKLDLQNDKFQSSRLNMIHYHLLKSQYLTGIKLIDELEIFFQSSHNYVRLLDIYKYAIILYSEIEKSLVKIYLKKLQSLIDKSICPNEKVMEVYAFVAYSFYNRNDFVISLEYFQKMIKTSDGIYNLSHVLYMANCQRQLKYDVEIPELDEKVLNKFPKVYQMMYSYYLHFKEVPLLIKQNIIVNEIAPYLTDNDFIKMFRYELRSLVEESSNYKSLLLFDKMIEKNNIEIK